MRLLFKCDPRLPPELDITGVWEDNDHTGFSCVSGTTGGTRMGFLSKRNEKTTDEALLESRSAKKKIY